MIVNYLILDDQSLYQKGLIVYFKQTDDFLFDYINHFPTLYFPKKQLGIYPYET